MDCSRAERLLHLWIDDALDEDQRRELTAHLAECSDCARKLAEYRHLGVLLHQLDAQTRVPAGLYGRIMEAVDRESAPGKGGLRRWTRWAASAAAVLLLGLTVGVLWRADIWPGPVGNSARYEMTQDEAAPLEAPAAEMGNGDAIMGPQFDDKGVVREELAEGSDAEEDSVYAGDTAMEATWIWNKTRGGGEGRRAADAIEAFSAEHGLTVVETGDDWISIQWERDADKYALLDFLAENGDLQWEDTEAESRILRIYIR